VVLFAIVEEKMSLLFVCRLHVGLVFKLDLGSDTSEGLLASAFMAGASSIVSSIFLVAFLELISDGGKTQNWLIYHCQKKDMPILMRVPCGLGFPAFRRKRCSFHRLFSNND
jgi:hypothetical protein